MSSIIVNHKNSFRILAYAIERKILELQMSLVAHRYPMRFIHIQYVNSLSPKEEEKLQEDIDKMYDLLERFCEEYSVPRRTIDFKAELQNKATSLWEDISGAASQSLYEQGELSETLKNDYEIKVTELIEEAYHLIKRFN